MSSKSGVNGEDLGRIKRIKILIFCLLESPLTDDSFSGGSKEDRRAEDQMKSQTIENGKPKKKRMFSQNLTMFSDTPLKPKKSMLHFIDSLKSKSKIYYVYK